MAKIGITCSFKSNYLRLIAYWRYEGMKLSCLHRQWFPILAHQRIKKGPGWLVKVPFLVPMPRDFILSFSVLHMCTCTAAYHNCIFPTHKKWDYYLFSLRSNVLSHSIVQIVFLNKLFVPVKLWDNFGPKKKKIAYKYMMLHYIIYSRSICYINISKTKRWLRSSKHRGGGPFAIPLRTSGSCSSLCCPVLLWPHVQCCWEEQILLNCSYSSTIWNAYQLLTYSFLQLNNPGLFPWPSC